MSSPAIKALSALGHISVESDLCTAREKHEKAINGRPQSPSRSCGLKAGHEGHHKHIYGTSQTPLRESMVEHTHPIQKCKKCGAKWPCQDAEKVLAAFN